MRESRAPSSRRGGLSRFDQHAVDPVANPHAVLERLDVDVRGPQLHGLADHELHQPHDRGAGFVDRRRPPSPPASSSVSVKSMAVSVNSCSIESADFVAHLAVVAVDGFENAFPRGQRDVRPCG